MKNYTKIPNEMLNESQLPIPARYLYCVLLKYCGKNEWCFPGQKTLAKILGYSEEYIRKLLKKLYTAGIVSKKRRGFNRTNTYKVAKSLEINRNSGSAHIGSKFPLHQGTTVAPKSIYLKGKGKRSLKGLEKCRKELEKKGIMPPRK